MTDGEKSVLCGVTFTGDDGGSSACCSVCGKELADGGRYFGTQEITITLEQMQEHQVECKGHR